MKNLIEVTIVEADETKEEKQGRGVTRLTMYTTNAVSLQVVGNGLAPFVEEPCRSTMKNV